MQTNNHFTLGLQTTKGVEFFLPEYIIRLEAKSNYTKIFFADHSPLLYAKVLKDFEPALIPYGFVRVHRSHLINPFYIHALSNDGEITMRNATVITISKRKKTIVMKTLRA